jgi:GNAT superfamily N-acetyltransferase
MPIGEQRAVNDLWEAARHRLPAPGRTGRASRSTRSRLRPSRERAACARRSSPTSICSLPACARAHEVELGIDPLERDANGFRWRTRTQIETGRSWLWAEDGVILFKAEASAWTPEAVQLQQVWTDPAARRAGNGSRGLRDLIRLLLGQVPRVCLFVRADNQPAIRLYDTVGMEHVLDYRSVLL